MDDWNLAPIQQPTSPSYSANHSLRFAFQVGTRLSTGCRVYLDCKAKQLCSIRLAFAEAKPDALTISSGERWTPNSEVDHQGEP